MSASTVPSSPCPRSGHRHRWPNFRKSSLTRDNVVKLAHGHSRKAAEHRPEPARIAAGQKKIDRRLLAMRVAIIGLGRMGAGIARRLMRRP
jgi:hypothetical protein